MTNQAPTTPTQFEASGPPRAAAVPFTEVMHGETIDDPYRWLEDASSPETEAWVRAQNQYTRSVLDRLPQRPAFRDSLERLFSIGTVTAPVQRNGVLFYTRRDPGRNQPRLIVRRAVEGADVTLVDPDEMDPDGTTSLDWWYPSRDGRLVAFGCSAGGDELSTLRVVEVESARLLDDTIPFTRAATVAWLPDGSGFYYTANVKTLPHPEDPSSYHHRAVYLHRLGADHQSDIEIFPDDGDPETIPAVFISKSGRWLVVWVHKGWDRSHVHVRDLSEDDSFVTVTEGVEALFNPTILDDRLYLHTNWEAPKYRLLEVDLAGAGLLQPLRHGGFVEAASERQDAILEYITPTNGRVALQYLRNAHSELRIAGSDQEDLVLELPDIGTVVGPRGDWDGPDLFFGHESFTTPPTVYRWSPDMGAPQRWQGFDPPAGLSGVTTEQHWYPSKDGTKISMFVVRPPEAPLDGCSPMALTGYGGFNVNRTPLFDRGVAAWLQAGGALALPNLRGGGEYGEDWHKAGMLERKQNVFDDFIAAAEWLTAEGYTSPPRLACTGGSNGGLLVGAAITQRPDLFRATVCSVPLLDMLRYQHYLIARLWIPEYGSAENPDQFPFLRAYSPYHNVRPDVEYPAVLFMSGASDTRVDPMHARKMAALMQNEVRARGPLLLRVEFEAGHGQGKPVNRLIEQGADSWSFLAWQLGLET